MTQYQGSKGHSATSDEGPANMHKNPIDGESYNFSFTLKTNICSNIQTKYHPTQKISKDSLVECYLLQEDWTSDKNYLHGLDSNIILNLWESNGEPTILEVIDPQLLAARTVFWKYNKDNPLYDTAT